MSPTIYDLGIDRMSAEDRLRLLGEIWDSLTHGEQAEIVDSHRDELDRRLDDADQNPSSSMPWEEVQARLRGE